MSKVATMKSKVASSDKNSTPWQKIKNVTTTNFSEGGFSGLETIPSGGYDLIKDEKGAWIIKTKATIPEDNTVPSETVSNPTKISQNKKKRAQSDSSSSGSKKLKVNVEPVDLSTSGEVVIDEFMYSWQPYSLHPFLLARLSHFKFTTPTSIQQKVLHPAIRSYRDVIGIAETGSGKTLGYGLPILHRLFERREKLDLGIKKTDPIRKWWKYLPALIITPTRELAVQVQTHLKDMLPSDSFIQIGVLVGGLSTEKQQNILSKHPDIIIATPGRLWDLVKSGEEYLSRLDLLQVS